MSEQQSSGPRPSRWHPLALLVAVTVICLPAHPNVSARVLAWLDALLVVPGSAVPDGAEPVQAPVPPRPAEPRLVPDLDVPGAPDATEPDEMPRPDEDPKTDEVERRERPSPPAPRVDPGGPAAPPQVRYV